MEIIYSTICGSQSQGLHRPGSDIDVRYITQQSLKEIISPFKNNNKVEASSKKDDDVESYTITHFAQMLCSGNATVYEVLRSDLYDKKLPLSDLIRSMLPLAFDARAILMAHIGYADAQISRYLFKASRDFKLFHKMDYNGINNHHSLLLGTPKWEMVDDHAQKKKTLQLVGVWEENHVKRISKSIVAGLRVLAQSTQLLTTGDFKPKISDYSIELHEKLMAIKMIQNQQITWEFIETHLYDIESEIKNLKQLYENLPDEIKNKKANISGIEDILCEIYGVK